MLMRVDRWDGLASNCGGITIAHGEFWNRVAYEAERALFLIGGRDTEPCVLDYADDITTPEQWSGERQNTSFSLSEPDGERSAGSES